MAVLASFDTYMLSVPRNELSQEGNDATTDNPPHPYSNDAGNWTGCRVYNGILVGTYKDVSVCFLSTKYGRPATKQELKSLTFDDVKNLFRPIWNSIGAGQLTDQDVANIYMHISLHYGNIHVAQQALNELGENLTVDGVAGPMTIAALVRQTKKNPVLTYNTIRAKLRASYAQNVNYAASFLSQLDRYFPVKSGGTSTTMAVGGTVLLLVGLGIAGWQLSKKKAS